MSLVKLFSNGGWDRLAIDLTYSLIIGQKLFSHKNVVRTRWRGKIEEKRKIEEDEEAEEEEAENFSSDP